MDKNLGQLIDSALEAAGIAWWEMELPSGKLRFGKVKTDLIGFKQKDFKHYTDFTKLVHPEDYEPMMEDMRKHIRGEKKIYEALYRIKTKSGEYIQFYDRGKIVEKNGDSIKIIGAVTSVNTLNDLAFRVALAPHSTNEIYNDVKDLAKETEDKLK